MTFLNGDRVVWSRIQKDHNKKESKVYRYVQKVPAIVAWQVGD